MSIALANTLRAQLEARNGEWPPRREVHLRKQISMWRAFQDADESALKALFGLAAWPADRRLFLDPLAQRIPQAFGDLVWGAEPSFTTMADADQPWLDGIVEQNSLPSELQGATEVAVGEGEVWARAYVDRELGEHPTIEWHSRLDVVPLWRGPRLLAAAFISELDTDEEREVLRHVELQAPGVVANMLYRGRADRLGVETDLGAHEATAGLEPFWEHGLPGMLCGVVWNRLGEKGRTAGSQYKGVEWLMLALHETVTIGQENARLAGKKRAIVPAAMLDDRGNFPAGFDVIQMLGTDADPDKARGSAALIEWEFDATQVSLWARDLEERILTRTRMAPQLVGRNMDRAESGAALRARLLDTVLAANSKGSAWDDALPPLLSMVAQLDALPVEQGGCGHAWQNPTEVPVIERTAALPVDEVEEATRHVTLVEAKLLSRRTAIQEGHPDWDEERIDEEMKLIEDEEPEPPPIALPMRASGNGAPPPPARAVVPQQAIEPRRQ